MLMPIMVRRTGLLTWKAYLLSLTVLHHEDCEHARENEELETEQREPVLVAVGHFGYNRTARKAMRRVQAAAQSAFDQMRADAAKAASEAMGG